MFNFNNLFQKANSSFKKAFAARRSSSSVSQETEKVLNQNL